MNEGKSDEAAGGLGAIPPGATRRTTRASHGNAGELCLFLGNEDVRTSATASALLKSASARPPTPSWPSGPQAGLPAPCPQAGGGTRIPGGRPGRPARRHAGQGPPALLFLHGRLGALAEVPAPAGSRPPSTGARRPGAKGAWVPTYLVLAMAHHQLGHAEQARRALDQAAKNYDWKLRDGIHPRPFAREAEQLIRNGPAGKAQESENNPD